MQNFFIISGPPGAGKTALLAELRQRGFDGVDEPARRILAEQRSFDGAGVPDRNPELFTELMLSRSVDDHRRNAAASKPVFFDRGVPDIIAYARLFGVHNGPSGRAAVIYRYNATAFFVPPWPGIYHQDDERKMSFDQASRFGDIMRQVYDDLDYRLAELPLSSPENRADFILARVRADGQSSN